jgi:hypothetical protein
MAVIRLSFAVGRFLQALNAPGAAQPVGQWAGTGGHGHAVILDIGLQDVEQQAAGVAGIVEIAAAELLFDIGGGFQEKVAFLSALHGSATLDPRRESGPGRCVTVQPFGGCHALLVLIGLGPAEGLVDEGIIAETAPGQNAIDLDPVVGGSNGVRRNLDVGITVELRRFTTNRGETR